MNGMKEEGSSPKSFIMQKEWTRPFDLLVIIGSL